MPVTVKQIELPAHRRAFAVSDVHGTLEYLKGLLAKISFTTDDILILLGDIVEKGPQSLDTLRFIMELSRTHTVYTLRGNCDLLLFDKTIPDEWLFNYRHHWNGNLLMNEFARELSLPLSKPEDISTLRRLVQEHFPEEVDFLTGLPVILESEHYIFVHGGIPGEDSLKDLSALTAWSCTKNDDFLNQGHVFRRKWCVVGHWPATLYRENHPCANPHISPEQQIVSIDGGCAIKLDAQLNALRLPNDPRTEDFSWVSYDSMPTVVALDAQAPSLHSTYIRYGDNRLEILERGEEFCTCLHPTSGKTLSVLTSHIVENKHGAFSEDTTDHILSVQPGNVLSVVCQTSRGWLVKKDGSTGWYRGRAEWRDLRE